MKFFLVTLFKSLLFGFMTYVYLLSYVIAMMNQNLIALLISIFWAGLFLILFPVFRKAEEIYE